MTPANATSLDITGALPPGCLYARGRFAFDLQCLPPEGRLRIAARQWGRVWLNGVPLGRLCPAWAAQSFPPSPRHAWWRIRPRETDRPLQFFHGYRQGSRLLVDGQEQELPLFPRMDWAGVYGSTPLGASDKPHEILGSYPKRPDLPYAASVPPLAFGWTQLPEGGECIEWAESSEGPWTEGRVEQDWEHQRMVEVIAP